MLMMTVMIAMLHPSVGADEPRLTGKDLQLSEVWGGWLTPQLTPLSLKLTFRCGITEQVLIVINSSAFARTRRKTIKLLASGRDVETWSSLF
jgi:hypothetical protein